MFRIITNNVGSKTVRCSEAIINASDLSKWFLVGAPDQGVGCEIRISLGVHPTQSARTPNQLECFPHQPASTVRVAFDLRLRDQAPCYVFQLIVVHGRPPVSGLLNLGQADSREATWRRDNGLPLSFGGVNNSQEVGG